MSKRFPGSTIEQPVTFVENAVYNSSQVARIIGRSVRCVRRLCSAGVLRARCDRSGVMITGWAIREYLENSCVLVNQNQRVNNIAPEK